MPDSHAAADIDDLRAEPSVPLSHFVHVLQRYARVITVCMIAVMVLYLIAATAIFLVGSEQTVVSLPFRLQFEGASTGTYPNGLKFSPAEIAATPILLEVYRQNGIAQFDVDFGTFSHAIYVVESNHALDLLRTAYEAKLTDPRLTPLDRDRLEREYDAKRESIDKSEYAIQFLVNKDTRSIPKSRATKCLADVVSVWARHAAMEKKVLNYDVPILSPAAVDNFTAVDGDYLLPLLVLRQRLIKTMADASLVREIPGAKLVRTPRGRSIAEVEVRLEEIARFRVEPLIAAAIANRLFGSNPAAREIVRAQLSFDQRLLLYMQGREAAFRNTLVTYQAQQGSRESSATPAPAVPSAALRPTGDAVMPMLSDTFLNRLVDLANNNVDREYRQKLSDQIKEASLDVIPAQMAVQYDNELLAAFPATPGTSGVAAASLQPQVRAAVAELRDALVDLNAIYAQASRQLYPETELYRVSAPAMIRVDRATSPMRLALFGFLTLLISFPVIVIAALLHNRIREEEAVDQLPEQG